MAAELECDYATDADGPLGQADVVFVGKEAIDDGAGAVGTMLAVKLGLPCVNVVNGIEYGDMQLICEAYNLMKNGLGMSTDQMHEVFKTWNEGDLDSYLIEITRDILGFKDTDGQPLVEKILDTAGQKGTGKKGGC